jgi:hypothetical protein
VLNDTISLALANSASLHHLRNVSTTSPVLLFTAIVLVAQCCTMRGAAEPVPGGKAGETQLVTLTQDSRLAYAPYSSRGDRLPDFSHCGFGGGGAPLPDAAVREALEPETGETDDTARIQAAIDRVSRLPPGSDGLRGAVLLKRGEYRCSGVLRIASSGVVLRGEGDGDNGTMIIATTRRQQPLLEIGGVSGPKEERVSIREVVDDYVPVGADTFEVADARDFAVGQAIFVVRRGNAAWISEIGMDRIAGRPADPQSTKQWTPFDLKFDRVITAVEGNRVRIDAPLACAIDRRWGGGAIVRYQDAGRIERCGVESLRAVAVFDQTKTQNFQGENVFVDENHALYLVSFGSVKNAWARRLTTRHFYHGPANIGGSAKWITVEDCRSLEPVSVITGGRRYPYNIDGQLALVQRCYSDRARHAFVFGARVAGPNVFLDCRSEHNYATSEPHHRWSVGGLYDNVEGDIAFQDRQWMGSGHGWAGANYVAWNCRGSLICQQPPTAQNFAIGFVGARGKDAFVPRPAGWWESEGMPVKPRSLYLQQLKDRTGRASQ